jgi:hypothetical protein
MAFTNGPMHTSYVTKLALDLCVFINGLPVATFERPAYSAWGYGASTTSVKVASHKSDSEKLIAVSQKAGARPG